jgi:hypothetical protein
VYYRSVAFANEAVGLNVPAAVEETAEFGSVAGAAVSTEPAIRIRHNFPETWLWDMLEAG